ncbi:hypothetical protein [Xanthocytophaga flava]|uniref:hypothetical protein n=1 Tax=Xanthocytophaga flava TaxID=3048013 RepID=UPI0028D54849|nr:hypothetical protein [Xanthocytophaga flavus]MDJ1473084.1 hypothetical protein [Xanthocytophaga flavus]
MKYLLFSFCMLFIVLSACTNKEQEKTAPQVAGTWIASRYDNLDYTGPRTETELQLNNDHTFLFRSSTFGLYENQKITDLSILTEKKGRFVQSHNILEFISEEMTITDVTVNSGQPVIYKPVPSGQALFPDCSYTISGNRLEVVYTGQGPTDGPVRAMITFFKKQ